MNDNVVDFVGLAVQWLLLPVLGVVLPKVHLGHQRMRMVFTLRTVMRVVLRMVMMRMGAHLP